MLIFVVFFVSVNILMVKTENDVVKVIIREGTQGLCTVKASQLTFGTKFNLEVISEFFIKTGTWTYQREKKDLETLENSIKGIVYNKTKHDIGSTPTIQFKYYYLHTRVVDENIAGNWTFSFKYLRNYDPWSEFNLQNFGNDCTCNASVSFNKVKIKSNIYKASETPTPTLNNGGEGKLPEWVLLLVLSLFGVFCVAQSLYIIYGKVKSRRAKRQNDEDPISPKSPKRKRSKNKRNIANRPPLPLPPDEDIQIPPQPPILPGAVHNHLFPTAPPMAVENAYSIPSEPGPLIPTQSYRNKAIDVSVEELRTPGFPRRHKDGPMVSNQSYMNKALVASVEELRTPGFPRRHIDGAMVTKQSYRNKVLDTSVEELKSPGFPRNHMDGPLVPKQSYKNNALGTSVEELRTPVFPRRWDKNGPKVPKQTHGNDVVSDDSDEEHRTPGFARRQIEAKFAQLKPKVAPSKSFKLPKPLPRSPPSPTLEKVPAFNPAHRTEPVPPLHPKKVPVFPPPEPFRKQDPSRMSDDEWQYEQLQPSSTYLKNFSTTNNYNR